MCDKTRSLAATVILGLTLMSPAAVGSQGSQNPPGAATPPPAFEVASVKVNRSGDFRRAIGPGPGGRFQALNVPLRDLVAYAYGVDMARAALQIAGGPAWLDRERFDVDALPATRDPSNADSRAMLRALLEERFTLVVHRETREVPSYGLVLDRDDRPPGTRLRPSAIDCEARRAANRARGAAPAPPPPGPPVDPATIRPVCGLRQTPGRFAGDAVSMTQLVSALSGGSAVGRIVTDRTGLAGYYDVDLEWTPDPAPAAGDTRPAAPVVGEPPQILTAVREQLGLRLESARTPLDVVVIDRAEMPADN